MSFRFSPDFKKTYLVSTNSVLDSGKDHKDLGPSVLRYTALSRVLVTSTYSSPAASRVFFAFRLNAPTSTGDFARSSTNFSYDVFSVTALGFSLFSVLLKLISCLISMARSSLPDALRGQLGGRLLSVPVVANTSLTWGTPCNTGTI